MRPSGATTTKRVKLLVVVLAVAVGGSTTVGPMPVVSGVKMGGGGAAPMVMAGTGRPATRAVVPAGMKAIAKPAKSTVTGVVTIPAGVIGRGTVTGG